MRKQILGTLLGAAALVGSGAVDAATIALYEFTGNSLISTDVDTNSTATAITTGGPSGITDSSGANAFGFTDASADNGDYLSFSIAPNLGFTLDLTALSFTLQRSVTQGSISIAARSSTDNFASSTLLSFTVPAPTATSKTLGGSTVATSFSIDLSNSIFDLIGSTGIAFRLYFTGSSSSASRSTTLDTIALEGQSVPTAVPLPPAAWLLGTALVGMMGIGRRKHV